MSDGFYRAFEERYYAPRAVIKVLRSQYLSFVTPLATIYPQTSTFDVGCGRGEWLELMTEMDLKPYGVDLDDGMLSACVELNLPAEKGDAIEFLAKLSDESQIIVSAFHVVEHISFEQLRILVSEALRVLKPGGLLIMETPNPENIVVATRNFYLDPTHLRPVPAQLLSFVPEYYGFTRVKTVRLQESKELLQSVSLTLQNVLGGVSPDYAVIAQKAAVPEIMAATSGAFEVEYGLSLETLANRYDLQAESRASKAEAVATAAESKALQAETLARSAELKAQQPIAQTLALEQRAIAAERSAQQWHQQANQWHEYVIALHKSTSWQMTKPLRAVSRVAQGDLTVIQQLSGVAKHETKKILRPLVSSCLAYVSERPVLASRLKLLAKHFPTLYQHLRRFAVNTGALGGGSTPGSSSRSGGSLNTPSTLQLLPPHARQIYSRLKAAIKNPGNRG
jgi:SAM-dependent methyltransferase